MDGADSGVVELADNLRCKINFVVRRTNARAELRDHPCGDAAVVFDHRFDCGADDCEFRSFFPAMHAADGATLGIDDENGPAIGDVNAEANARIVRDERIDIPDWRRRFRIHGGDSGSVNLLRGGEAMSAEAKLHAELFVCFSEPCERGLAVGGYVNAGREAGEGVNDGQAGKCGVCFARAVHQRARCRAAREVASEIRR